MCSSRQGCLPVLDGDAVVGIITEHDLAEAMAKATPTDAPVAAYMSDGSVTVKLNDDCQIALLKMLAVGCRHLPVVDGDKLVGMISIRDAILKVAAEAPLAHTTLAAAGA